MNPNQETQFCLVLVTASSQAEAKTLADALLQEHLAACVNLFPVESVYRWEGEIQHDHEYQLLIKTSLEQFDSLEAKILELHSYDVPEIIAVPFLKGAQPYLSWMEQALAR